MRIHLIKERSIREYSMQHAGSKTACNEWLIKIKFADWEHPNDIKRTFASADLLGKNRVVFNIGGNNYRMICKYHFGETEVHVFVCWIGTHAEYDKICRSNKQYTINEY